MKQKRLLGTTLLGIFLIFGGIVGVLSSPLRFNYLGITASVISTVITIASIVCGFGLFKLKPWGHKFALVYIICGMMYGCIYQSPIMHSQRMQYHRNMYNRIINNNKQYKIKGKEVSKEEYISYSEKMLSKQQEQKTNKRQLLFTIIFDSLILLYLSRPKVRNQFKKERNE